MVRSLLGFQCFIKSFQNTVQSLHFDDDDITDF